MDATKQDMALDEKCRETIDRTFPFFVIHNNHVTIPPNTTLYSICSQVFTTALDVFALPNSQATVLGSHTTLTKLLASIFDADHRAFVLEEADAARILAVLDEDAKACILAQAIAGIVFVLRRLAEHHQPGIGSSGEPTTATTAQAFDRQLRWFFGSEERRTILARIERSHLWGNCFAKPQILDMIMEAIDVDGKHVSGKSSPALKLEDDIDDPVAWADEQRPARNLGVPDGLTIMALN